MIQVLNKADQKESTWDDVYVGRNSPLGNPFKVKHSDERAECIERYKDWLCLKIFKKDPEIRQQLNTIVKKHLEGNVNLMCWCKPMACHADFIKKIVELKLTYKGGLYAGIGSRKTPPNILNLMQNMAKRLYLLGYTLRSGGAAGADINFERGHNRARDRVNAADNKEIFLAGHATEECLEVAERIHPAWERCSDYAKTLHARNVKQILGNSLDCPVDFVLCWTPNGEPQGGTRTAIMVAKENGIPVFNLFDEKNRDFC